MLRQLGRTSQRPLSNAPALGPHLLSMVVQICAVALDQAYERNCDSFLPYFRTFDGFPRTLVSLIDGSKAGGWSENAKNGTVT